MKLAEALLARRDLQNNLTNLKNTMVSFALIEDGDVLEVSMDDLMKEFRLVNEQLEKIIVKIQQRNQEIIISETKETLQSALEKRENLRQEYSLYKSLLDAMQDRRRFGRNEIKMVPSYSQKKLTTLLNETAQNLRQVDSLIQQTNWLEEF